MPEKLGSMALIVGIMKRERCPIEVTKEDVHDEDVLAVIHQCLEFDPKKRITFKDIEKRLSNALEKCKRTNKNDSNDVGETKKSMLDSLCSRDDVHKSGGLI